MKIFSLILLFFLCFSLLHSKKMGYIIYKVQKGDNITLIAEKYGVLLEDIIRWNSISNKNTLYVGQALKVYQKHPTLKKSTTSESQIPFIKKARGFDFIYPIQKFLIVKKFSEYGDTKNYGLLLKTDINNIVFSAYKGKVVEVGRLHGYGNYVLIDHGKGWISMYSNLKSIFVKKGSVINKRQSIGRLSKDKLFFLISHEGVPKNPKNYLQNIFS